MQSQPASTSPCSAAKITLILLPHVYTNHYPCDITSNHHSFISVYYFNMKNQLLMTAVTRLIAADVAQTHTHTHITPMMHLTDRCNLTPDRPLHCGQPEQTEESLQQEHRGENEGTHTKELTFVTI